MTDIHSRSHRCTWPDCTSELARQIDEQGAQLERWRDRAVKAEVELAEYRTAADKLAAENKVLRDELARLREQKPMAWAYVNYAGECEQIEWGTEDVPEVAQLLYAAPPAQPALRCDACGKTMAQHDKMGHCYPQPAEPQRLTDEQIKQIIADNGDDLWYDITSLARAIESAIIEKAAP